MISFDVGRNYTSCKQNSSVSVTYRLSDNSLLCKILAPFVYFWLILACTYAQRALITCIHVISSTFSSTTGKYQRF